MASEELQSILVPEQESLNYGTINASNRVQQHAISWIDVILLSAASSFNFLIFKSWFVFTDFVDDEYNVTFYELSWSLSITQLSPIPVLFIAPMLNRYKCNHLFFGTQVVGIVLVILNSVLNGCTFNFFVISFLRSFMVQIFWTIGNSAVYQLMLKKEGEKEWRKNMATTIFMGSWTFSTILFLISGLLIDEYGFRLTMIMVVWLQVPICFILLFRIPAISLNDFIKLENEMNGKNEIECDNHNSPQIFSDLKGLFQNAVVVLIMFNAMACVTNWGCYYGSFGVWLQELFDLNGERIGLCVTICEATAEFVSLCAIPILSRFISNSSLCITGGIFEALSVVLLNIILWNDEHVLNAHIMTMDQEWMRIGAILFVIFLFYLGHETLYIALLVNLDSSIVPKRMRSTAVACYGCFDFTGAFIGQLGVTYIFANGGMKAMAPYMLIVEGLSAACLIAMNVVLCNKKKFQSVLQNLEMSQISGSGDDRS